MTRLGTKGYKILRGEYRADDTHPDELDCCQTWWDAAVAVLAGPCCPMCAAIPDVHEAMIADLMTAGDVTTADVVTFLQVLGRYERLLKAAR